MGRNVKFIFMIMLYFFILKNEISAEEPLNKNNGNDKQGLSLKEFSILDYYESVKHQGYDSKKNYKMPPDDMAVKSDAGRQEEPKTEISGAAEENHEAPISQDETKPQSEVDDKAKTENIIKEETVELKKDEIPASIVEHNMPAYTFSLKELIEEAKRRQKQAREKIEEKKEYEKNRAKDLQIREYFAKGEEFYKQGNMEEAIKEWDKVLSLTEDSAMKEYIQKTRKEFNEQEAALKEKTEFLYNQALSLYSIGNYEQASEKFEEANVCIPGYKEAERYLASIPSDIEKQKQRAIEEEKRRKISRLYIRGAKFFEEGRLDKATEAFSVILSIDAGEARAKDYLEIKIPDKRISGRYEEAVKLYSSGEYDEAKLGFEKIQGQNSRYDDKIKKHLKAIEDKQSAKEKEDILRRQRSAEEEKQKKIKDLYIKGAKFFEDGQLDKARESFVEILSIDAGEARAKDYLEIKIPDKRINMVYEEAAGLYDSGRYGEAKIIFEAIHQQNSRYESRIKKYLKAIEDKRAALEKAANRENEISRVLLKLERK